jgi:hypothetical protein
LQSVYRSAQVLSAEPFNLKTAQNKITTAKIESKAPIGRFRLALKYNFRKKILLVCMQR